MVNGDLHDQRLDISPGFGPKVGNFDTGNGYGTRVFWVAQVPDSDLTVNLAKGTAELKVTDLAEYDYHNFIDSDSTDWQFDNSAAHPQGFYNATLSFDIKWNGPVAETDQVKDTANGFAGTFYQNDATTTWNVTSNRPAAGALPTDPPGGTGHFTFHSDPNHPADSSYSNSLVPGSAFIQLASEQNGVFFPSGAALKPDPLNNSLSDLVVDGSSTGGVHIHVQSEHGGNDIQVRIDGAGQHYQNEFPAAAVANIIVNSGPGDNHIEVGNDVRQPAALLGSFGDDHIQGGGGRTIIIGGLGSDHLEAGSGGTILIAGTTNLFGATTNADREVPALVSLMAEWARTDESYLQRVANLSNSTVAGVSPNGLGKNGGYFLNDTTVHDDAAGNHLEGGPGLDWFFANLDGVDNNNVKDKLAARKAGEIVTRITSS